MNQFLLSYHEDFIIKSYNISIADPVSQDVLREGVLTQHIVYTVQVMGFRSLTRQLARQLNLGEHNLTPESSPSPPRPMVLQFFC